MAGELYMSINKYLSSLVLPVFNDTLGAGLLLYQGTLERAGRLSLQGGIATWTNVIYIIIYNTIHYTTSGFHFPHS